MSIIKSISYSKLLDAEQCMLRLKMKHVDKIPEQKAPAAERGTLIHQMAEDFVRGKLKSLPTELMKFADEFDTLRREFKSNNVSLEGEWGFDKDWMQTDYKTAWLRMKADGVFFLSEREGVVIDYKTGQSYGNEIKHGEQVLLYAIATFILWPKLDNLTVELWYLDKDEMLQKTYTRAQALRMVQQFDKRMKRVTSATEFPANPNIFSCKWCPYGPAKGNQCPHGVAAGQNTIQMYRNKFG